MITRARAHFDQKNLKNYRNRDKFTLMAWLTV